MTEVVEVKTPTTVITSVTTEGVVVSSQPAAEAIVLQPIVGVDGREVQLQNSGTHIQWKYQDEASWANLVAVADLEGADGTNGQEVSMQTTGTHIQWRLGVGTWNNLVALADLEGGDGLSAYQIALNNGFVGTEAEWLESLKGEPGESAGPHTHIISEVTGLQAELDSKQASGDYATNTALTDGLATKAAATHTHTASEITDFNSTVDGRIQNIIGTAPETLDTLGEIADALADDANFAATVTTQLAGKSDVGHGHAIGDITNLQTTLDGKQASGDYATNTALTNGLAGKADSTHNHAAGEITGLATIATSGSADNLIDGTTNKVYTATEKSKLGGIATGATANSSDATLLARANHTGSQAISTITGLQTALDGKQAAGSYATSSDLTTGLAGKANSAHTHGIADLPAVMVPVLYNGTSWPARPTDRTDVVVMWLDFTGNAAAPAGGIQGLDVVLQGVVA